MARTKVPSDTDIREYVQEYPDAIARLAGLGTEYDCLGVGSPALPSSDRTADLVTLLRGPSGRKLALHAEFQTQHKPDFPARMLEYAVRVWLRERCDLLSVAVYLTPGASRAGRPGYVTFGAAPDTEGSFRWKEIHAWTLGLDDPRIGDSLELLPLLAAASRDATPQKLLRAWRRASKRLGRGAEDNRNLMVILDGFASTRFDLKSSLWSLEREDEMQIAEKSPLMKRARAEGRAEGMGKGRVEGIAEGRAEGLVEGRLAALKSLVGALGATWRPAYSAGAARLTDCVLAELIIRASREQDPKALQRLLDGALRGEYAPHARKRSMKAL